VAFGESVQGAGGALLAGAVSGVSSKGPYGAADLCRDAHIALMSTPGLSLR